MAGFLKVRIIRLLLGICILAAGIMPLSCEDNEEEYKEFLNKKDVHIFGIKKLSQSTIVILKSEEGYFGDILILALNARNKIINSTSGYLASSHYPFFFDKSYFLFVAASDEYAIRSGFIIYDEKSNKFLRFKEDNGFVGYVIIFNNNLYYSTDKINTCVRRINLETGKLIKYDIYSPNAKFYIIEDEVYIKDYLTGRAYLVEQDTVIRKDASIFEGKSPIIFDNDELRNEEELEKYGKILGLN